MIPKIIHYCWFGNNPIPKETCSYIKTWKKYCPDYKFIFWNEKTFNVNVIPYTSEAYKCGKYAFVSDYVRLWALYQYGGIYLDTDIRLLKPLDALLDHHGFTGFEHKQTLGMGVVGFEKKSDQLFSLMKLYINRHFVMPDGSMEMQTINEPVTDFFLERGLTLNGNYQIVNGVAFYPPDYFYPLDNQTFRLRITENSYTIHYYAGTWADSKRKRNRLIKKLLGPRITEFYLYFREAVYKNRLKRRQGEERR